MSYRVYRAQSEIDAEERANKQRAAEQAESARREEAGLQVLQEREAANRVQRREEKARRLRREAGAHEQKRVEAEARRLADRLRYRERVQAKAKEILEGEPGGLPPDFPGPGRDW